ncbi:unnamed protein product [Dracunculus medinensis]|uniref:Uncharacterized protein n=1 Tax=Dracunculus medinensis TaxID=318479 RepID=A0A0N4UIV6_DRAME|nr:unnamed protein product [Dracunculus medinensis]
MSISQEILALIRRVKCPHFDEFESRKRIRQFFLPRRICIFAIGLFVLLYFLIFSKSSTTSIAELCLDDRLRHWKLRENDFSISLLGQTLHFTANGFLGIGNDGELRIKDTSSRVLSFVTAFFPLISARIEQYNSESSASITDYRTGTIKRIQCFTIEKCVCITRSVYAHRSRPHILVQEIQTNNPTVRFQIFFKNEFSSIGDSFVYTRSFESKSSRTTMAVICSSVPKNVIVEWKREDSSRFTCAFDYEVDLLGLHSVTFGISKSFAPNALNPRLINFTRYALLANSRDLLIEKFSTDEQKKVHLAFNLLLKNDMCYNGHSTLMMPSKLWKASESMSELIRTIDIWILTLEKRGCFNLVKAGATGIAQAFVLSLLAFKFSGEHMEMEIDPSDLHREISVNNLPFSPNINLSIVVQLDDENRPYFLLSSPSLVYACDAGCLDVPIELGQNRVRLPIKVTRPLTPILYISANKKHLEQLHGAIHVFEVVNAPAHEHDLIALHKHGHRLGGLPLSFWVLLCALVIVFHLFLFKLLYSEWKKGDSTPYNYYLRQRYMRTH